MASIRRTLSPVPRPGTAMNGEACLAGSPLSRSSAFSLESHDNVLSMLSPKISRPAEKSKHKGQPWKRPIFQFVACFVFGVFIGFTPFLSANLVSKHQAFPFDMVSSVGNIQPFDSESKAESLSENYKVGLLASLFEDTIGNQSYFGESELEPRKLLIVVTPTYFRPFQAYYLNRLSHTLQLVPSPMLWIVVEMFTQSSETAGILRKSGVMYRHLVCDANQSDVRDMRIHQRNVALKHIETHRLDGIVYFADDGNVYSTELFDQLRLIRRFGTWKVAKVVNDKHDLVLDGPVCNGTEVIGWHVNKPKQRYQRFYAELSGFAFNSTVLWNSESWHRPMLEPIRHRETVSGGLQVSSFIEQIVEDESQMEVLVEDCLKIMVWNLHLESANSAYPREWVLKDNLDAVASLLS